MSEIPERRVAILARKSLRASGDKSLRGFPLAVILLIIAAVTAFSTYFTWVRGADHRDFYPIWAGARRILLGSADLYSIEATHEMQVMLYGRELPPERDQQGFAYPAILLPIILPFALIKDVEIATAIWQGTSVAMLVLGLLHLHLQRERTLVAPLLLSISWFFTLLMLFQGQTTWLLVAGLSFGYWGLSNNHALLGGAITSIALIKPDLAILPVIVLGFLSLRRRQVRFLIGLLAATIVLMCISYLLVGPWIAKWLEALARYSSYARVTIPILQAAEVSPWLPPILGLFALIGMWLVRNDDCHLFAIVFPVQMILFPQTLIWGLSILVIVLNLVWRFQTRNALYIVWLVGWLSSIGNLISPGWWSTQILFVALSVEALVLYSWSRGKATESSTQNAA